MCGVFHSKISKQKQTPFNNDIFCNTNQIIAYVPKYLIRVNKSQLHEKYIPYWNLVNQTIRRNLEDHVDFDNIMSGGMINIYFVLVDINGYVVKTDYKSNLFIT